MAVIWGLDLHEIRWNKFKSSYMWNAEYHRRRTKFIVYQAAMILCVVSESLGTAALSDYVEQQDYVAQHAPHARRTATVHNDDFVGAASFNIFAGVFVATVFGAAFFFDLFWPERAESAAVKTAWRVCSVLAAVAALASALAMTVVVAAHAAWVSGVGARAAERLLERYGGSPLAYRENGRAVASVVFIWPGAVATAASAVLMWRSIARIDAHGPKAARTRRSEAKELPAELDAASELADVERAVPDGIKR